MKLGRYFKPGDKIPANTTYIDFFTDYPKRAVITQSEVDLYVKDKCLSATYEVKDFDFPCRPPQPEICEVWEVEFRETKERLLARYQGEKSKMQEVFGGEWLDWFPCDYKFIRRWTPDKQ